ncbi:MAG: flavin reductase family protein [Candidatus Izemoplasmatales bacterium]
MYVDVSPFEYAGSVLERMKPGVFLTASTDGKANTMIIGWGGPIMMWNRPMVVVFVRDIRATYPLIEKSGEFTVSVPLRDGLADAIRFCGTKSGRDVDKFAACGLTPVAGRFVGAPVIGECDLHYECRIMYRQKLDQAAVPQAIKDRFYSNPANNANHTVYYADILGCYVDGRVR